MIIAHLKQTQHPVQSCLEMNRKYTLLGSPRMVPTGWSLQESDLLQH